ncbi:MAG: PIN domain-containing protein [Brevinematales bacterium]|nr:PIN domain-containing protein [Brevinematales bacterium]
MSDRIFLDTNILVYAFDKEIPVKQTRAKDLLKNLFESVTCFISTQVISEFCNIGIKKMRPALDDATLAEFTALIPESQIHIITKQDILNAIGNTTRLGLSYWDALIVAASLSADCEILYTEDLQDGFRIGNRLTIVNPFR